MRKNLLLAIYLLCGALSVHAQTYTPIQVSGFNQDVICENNSSPEAVAMTMSQFTDIDLQGIDGSGFGFYTAAVQEEGALCGVDNKFKSQYTGAEFLVNVTGLNALVLKGTKTAATETGFINSPTEGDLKFRTPMSAKSIYVIGTSADGNTDLQVTVNYEDGSTVVDNITMNNWDTPGSAIVSVSGLGRIASKKNWAGDAGKISSSYNFNLYESAVNTDPAKKITSVHVKQTNSGTSTAIFGVTISNDAVQSGISSAVVNNRVEGYYTTGGVKLVEPVEGVNIVKYSDGTTRSILIK